MICVIDYGMGNLRSVSKALEKVGGEVRVSSNAKDLETAEKLVLPGVGAFGDGCVELRKRELFEPLRKRLLGGASFLGICLGMQLLFEESEENPGEPGLGIFQGRVKRFRTHEVKIPHMGWNEVKFKSACPAILRHEAQSEFFYFVHSFYPVPTDDSLVLATSEYGGEAFPALIGQGRLWACQFHPEKSQDAGLRLLKGFVHS